MPSAVRTTRQGQNRQGMSIASPRAMLRGGKAWSLVQPIVTIADRHGLDASKLRGCLFAGDPKEPPPRTVPIQNVMSFWAHVATATRDAALPLRAAQLIRIEDLAIMGFASMTAPTGYEAFERALRYLPLVTSSGRWRAEQVGTSVNVSWLRGGERWLGHRLANESGTAAFVACLRQIYGPEFTPTRVSFRHAPPPAIDAHRRFFRCAVEFGEERDGFSFPSRLLDHTPPFANPPLARYLAAEAEAQLRAQEPSSLTSSVCHQLEHQLTRPEPKLSAPHAARALGVSPRTLRRQLELEGTFFRALLGQAQRNAAHVLLQHTRLPITDVALRVGFSDSAAFAHAVRRWFARSPRQLRLELRPTHEP